MGKFATVSKNNDTATKSSFVLKLNIGNKHSIFNAIEAIVVYRS